MRILTLSSSSRKKVVVQKGSIFCNYSPRRESDRLMVLGLITGATTIEVRVASKVRVSQFSVQSNDLLYRTTTQRRPMYSISTDSISMKTNCSDFEDGTLNEHRTLRQNTYLHLLRAKRAKDISYT